MLIVELVTAAALLSRPIAHAPSAPAHTMRLVDWGGPPQLPARIAAEMPAAVAAVSAFWGDAWPPDVPIVTTGSDADFAAQTGDPARDWTGVAAVAVADRVDPSRREASGQRIVFAPGADAMSAAALQIVLRHELFHYAARAETPLDAPRWLTEGVADYVARPAGPRPGPAAVPARLPSDDDLTGPEQSAAYDRAWWFARFVADEYGAPALRRLYVAAGDPQAALGVGWNDLLTRWQRWLSG
ncbi:MAG: hypothetical protein ACM4D3_14255 [Candidatus Sericytochromatia bacterium]